MTKILNPKYKAPSRDTLSNHLIPAWYGVEKANLISELKHVSKAAITADGWTSFSQDHYLTVTLHYVKNGQAQEKVLKTKAVYQAQTGTAVAEEIDEILEEYGIREKIVAATVDNAGNMDVAIKKLHIIKFPCFAHTLNLGAQKLYNCPAISNWAARIRSVILWLKRSHMAKVVLKEKQDLLKLPKHMLLLDVKTRLAKMGNDDLRKAEEFVLLMRKHYYSTLAVSSDKSPTCGEILPILQKLQQHYTTQEDDSPFIRSIKENIWKDLSKRYQLPQQEETQREGSEDEDEEEDDYVPPVKLKKTALEKLFEEEDNELQSFQLRQPILSLVQRVDQDIQLYRSLAPIPCKDNATLWWWSKRETLPLLSELAESFLCVQASSTPSERVFSTAGDTISPERSRILPEKADMLIFLQKNC
ncbi:hypothetical protein OJAV_G00108960 [Oryzias javanicus]|uniref:HAT C-terminal dimerisation domain-containing protein n=1 Tax=Oryzias javanicus TaxID=123683 RepID=A0A3S2P7R5_ORYJA|nr:hypothetical protein OJAV_G00108960 [Oryzias javanicus]